MSVEIQPQWLTVDLAAEYSSLSTKSIRRLISAGKLQAYRPCRGRVLINLGELEEAKAIALAQQECDEDEIKRVLKNEKAAVKRVEEDKIYIAAFSNAIRKRYPNCPKNREVAIATHACEKYSGRVGRTADAKQFDAGMIDLAVEAHIRHKETNYDNQFNKGKTKRLIRMDVKQDITTVLNKWRNSQKQNVH